MSLAKCPECQGQVSSLATVCPHCGYPLQRRATTQSPAFPEVQTPPVFSTPLPAAPVIARYPWGQFSGIAWLLMICSQAWNDILMLLRGANHQDSFLGVSLKFVSVSFTLIGLITLIIWLLKIGLHREQPVISFPRSKKLAWFLLALMLISLITVTVISATHAAKQAATKERALKPEMRVYASDKSVSLELNTEWTDRLTEAHQQAYAVMYKVSDLGELWIIHVPKLSLDIPEILAKCDATHFPGAKPLVAFDQLPAWQKITLANSTFNHRRYAVQIAGSQGSITMESFVIKRNEDLFHLVFFRQQADQEQKSLLIPILKTLQFH